MNANWRNRPTCIDYIPRNIDYVIGIDESGNADLSHIQKIEKTGGSLNINERRFTVTACRIAVCNFISLRDKVMAVKRKYWSDALFDYDGTVKRVCFHSREIRNRYNAFRHECIDYDSFILDLSQLLHESPIILYSSHIDKLSHIRQYAHPLSPYDLCMTFVLERIMYNIGQNDKCIIVLEARGKDEDRNLLNFIKRLIDHGSNYCSAATLDWLQ